MSTYYVPDFPMPLEEINQNRINVYTAESQNLPSEDVKIPSDEVLLHNPNTDDYMWGVVRVIGGVASIVHLARYGRNNAENILAYLPTMYFSEHEDSYSELVEKYNKLGDPFCVTIQLA